MKAQSTAIALAAILVGAAIGHFVPPLFSNAAEPAEEDAKEEAKATEKRAPRTRAQSSRGHDADLNRLRSRIKSLERQLAEQGNAATEEPIEKPSTNRVERQRRFGPPTRADLEEMRKNDPARYAQETNRIAQFRHATHRRQTASPSFVRGGKGDSKTSLTYSQARTPRT